MGAVAALLLMGGLASAAQADATPPNDAQANATVVSALPTTDQVDTTAATNEANEPNDCGTGAGHTVWYRVDVPSGTDVQVKTEGSNFDTVLAVYEVYSDNTSAVVACDDDSGPDLTSSTHFRTYSGSTYLVQAGGYQGDFGALHIRFSTVEPLGNDNFANAVPLESSFDELASNGGATKEDGEPLPCNRYLIDKTVWFSWTAPDHGLLSLYGGDRVIGLYAGTSLSNLQPIGCSSAGGYYYESVPVEAGQTYYIQVGVNDLQAPDEFELWGSFEPRGPFAANDELANAESIGALGETHTADATGATLSNGEPACGYMEKSLWYSYTATQDGPLVVSTEGSQTEAAVGVYTGTDYANLSQVACADDNGADFNSRAGFTATAGQTYLVQVGAACCGDSISVAIYQGQTTGAPLGVGSVTETEQNGQPHEVSGEVLGFGAGARTGSDPDSQRKVVCGEVVLTVCEPVPGQ